MDMVLLLGLVTGMRSMTALTVVCWAAWLGDLPEHGWAVWISYLVFAIVFSACATGEYVADTLPKTPNRTDHGPALARIVIGALVGSLAATAIHEPLAGGIIFGAFGALIGTWGSFWVRSSLTRLAGRDFPIALLESASALALAIIAVVRLHHGIVLEMTGPVS
jgi:uncharacterized membrane protein